MKSSVSGDRLRSSSSSAGQLIWLCPIVWKTTHARALNQPASAHGMKVKALITDQGWRKQHECDGCRKVATQVSVLLNRTWCCHGNLRRTDLEGYNFE